MAQQVYGHWLNDTLYNVNSPKGELMTHVENHLGNTVHELFETSIKKYGGNQCVGVRERLKTEMVADKSGKKFEKLTLAKKYEWMTYSQFGARARQFGSGLMSWSGIAPKSRMLIYADTQRDWMTAMFGGFNHNLTTVTCYATLGAAGAEYAINAVKCPVVVADGKLLKILLEVQPNCPCITHIVSISEMEPSTKESLEAKGVKVSSFEELIKIGEAEVAKTPPQPEDAALIMFTSGTTGNPKGVVLAHKNIVAVAASSSVMLKDAKATSKDVIVGYLPLAHIMEIAVEVTWFCTGGSIGYGSPHTLTDSGVKHVAGQPGDLKVLKPTFVVFAPLVLEKLYNTIVTKVSGTSGLKQKLFNKGLKTGEKRFAKGKVGASSLYQKLVFKKIQAMVGGKLRFAITGSAPLDGQVHKFVQTVLNVPVKQGYGLTETCAASVIQTLSDGQVGAVGCPTMSACIKLVDWEEGGYRSSDIDKPEIGMRRGEIVIGGPAVSSDGYLVDPENPDPAIVKKNEEEFRTENGIRSFYTGDIGAVQADGTIKIIDRKKDLVKLQNGEYVALAKVEGICKLAALVENCLVHADPTQKFCTVLVVPLEAALVVFGQANNLDLDAEALSKHEKVISTIKEQVTAICKEKKLASFEIPAKITVVPLSRAFTPENGLLTAVMKLKRKAIQTAFESEIKAMY